MFQNNQRQFYRELNQEEERCDDHQPDTKESKKFQEDKWSESIDHNRDAKWLKELLMVKYLKERTCETKKSVFYFTLKACFILGIIKF